jgi:hypothetical protein
MVALRVLIRTTPLRRGSQSDEMAISRLGGLRDIQEREIILSLCIITRRSGVTVGGTAYDTSRHVP